MTHRSWIRQLFVSKTRTLRKGKSRIRPQCETLEDRAMLANYTAANVAELVQTIALTNLLAGANTITLTADNASPYTLTAPTDIVNGFNGLPTLAVGNALTIVGDGDVIQRSTAAGTFPFRLFNVPFGAALSLQSVTLENGIAVGVGEGAKGGAVYSLGALGLDHVTIRNNQAIGWVGAGSTLNSSTAGASGEAAYGGGVYVGAGFLTISDSVLANNTATGGKGGEGYGEPTPITDCQQKRLPGGTGGEGSGGGLYVGSTLSTRLARTTFRDNVAQGGEGGKGGSALQYTWTLFACTSSETNPAAKVGGFGGLGAGGGVRLGANPVILEDNVFTSNTARGGVGGEGGDTGRTFTDEINRVLENGPIRPGTGGVGGGALGGGLAMAATTAVNHARNTVTANQAVGGEGGFAGGYEAAGTLNFEDPGGFTNGSGGHGGNACGGGLQVLTSPGAVTLTGWTVSGNRAESGDGQISRGDRWTWGTAFSFLTHYSEYYTDGVAGVAQGGGICAATGGDLILSGVTVSNNTADAMPDTSSPLVTLGNLAAGGGIYLLQGSLVVNDSLLSGNTATGGEDVLGQGAGGGLYVFNGSLRMARSTIRGNVASGAADDVSNAVNNHGWGGGVYVNFGLASLTDVDIVGNQALGGSANVMGDGGTGRGGGVYVGGGIFSATGGRSRDNIARGGNASGVGGNGMGGGVYVAGGTVGLSNQSVSGNRAEGGTGSSNPGTGHGGGIYNDGILTIAGDVVANNYSAAEGGGVYNAESLTVVASTLSDNTSDGCGGGLFNLAGTTLSNSTFARNSALSDGGAAYNSGVLLMAHTTMSRNAATLGVGGVSNFGGLAINNSIVANHAGGDVGTSGGGSFTGSHNLFGAVALGPLADNGGPTPTMALPPGSAALGGGENALVPVGLTFDQRGPEFDRIVGTVDIGAFEAQTRTPTVAADLAAVSVNEGSLVTNTGTFDDPDGNGTVTLSASVGNVAQDNGANTWSWSYLLADGLDGPMPVTITATSSGGLNASTAFTLTVNNVAPGISISGEASVNEGETYTLNLGAITDPGPDTVTQYVMHWGDGSSDTYTTDGDKTHVYVDGPATYAITVDLSDEDGTHTNRANALGATVNNVAPSIAITGAFNVNEVATYTLNLGAITDPGPDTVTQYVVHWGDGSSDTYTTASDKTHVYADGPATGAITVDLIDEDGTHTNRANAVLVDDRNQDGVIDVRDLDDICAAIVRETVTREELEGFWSRQNTGPGDANFDHQFDSADLVAVFQRGKYETNMPAEWSDGDWNCDGLFGSRDLVVAFQRGWYERALANALAAMLDEKDKKVPGTLL